MPGDSIPCLGVESLMDFQEDIVCVIAQCIEHLEIGSMQLINLPIFGLAEHHSLRRATAPFIKAAFNLSLCQKTQNTKQHDAIPQ